MATILPFKAFRPNPMRADSLVFAEEKIKGNGIEHTINGSAHTLKSMLESGARVRPELPETQARAYEQINQKIEELLEEGDIWHEQHAGFYVYEIAHPKYRQTGIWALTDIEDYTTGRIKTHENTSFLLDVLR